MAINEPLGRMNADQPEWQSILANLMPVTLLEASDITDAMVFLCGHSGRYITGITLPVDAGNAVR